MERETEILRAPPISTPVANTLLSPPKFKKISFVDTRTIAKYVIVCMLSGRIQQALMFIQIKRTDYCAHEAVDTFLREVMWPELQNAMDNNPIQQVKYGFPLDLMLIGTLGYYFSN